MDLWPTLDSERSYPEIFSLIKAAKSPVLNQVTFRGLPKLTPKSGQIFLYLLLTPKPSYHQNQEENMISPNEALDPAGVEKKGEGGKEEHAIGAISLGTMCKQCGLAYDEVCKSC